MHSHRILTECTVFELCCVAVFIVPLRLFYTLVNGASLFGTNEKLWKRSVEV